MKFCKACRYFKRPTIAVGWCIKKGEKHAPDSTTCVDALGKPHKKTRPIDKTTLDRTW